jgi:hypothetical protein
MDTFTNLFWMSSLLFLGLSIYLVFRTVSTHVLYAQIASGCGMFITSKIGRKFFGLDSTVS